LGFLYDNFISGFFSTALQWIHDALTGDYVIAILLVALLLRLVLLPLDVKQKRQMRKITAMQERVDKIKERYANNKEKQQKKISELYKQEGVSPFSSCLPLLFQFVFLLAFFGAVRSLSNHETVAMVAQAAKEGTEVHLPSCLWIKNIWQPDALSLIEYTPNVLPSAADFQNIIAGAPALKEMLPQGFDYAKVVAPTISKYMAGGAQGFFEQIGVVFKQSNGLFLLPVLAGASAYFQGIYQIKSGMVQQQGKIMKYGLPLFSVYICAVTGTAFAIYWTFTNVFSIVQQLALNAYFRREEENGGEGGGKEKKLSLAFWKRKKEKDVQEPGSSKEDT
jgi:YidC/Oxa1 family membrane protein insertase